MSLVALLGLRRTARATVERDLAAASAVRARAERTRAEVVGRMHGDPHLLDSAGDARLLLARRAGQLADLSRADDALVRSLGQEDHQQVLVAQARMRLKAVERLQERRDTEERRERDRREAARARGRRRRSPAGRRPSPRPAGRLGPRLGPRLGSRLDERVRPAGDLVSGLAEVQARMSAIGSRIDGLAVRRAGVDPLALADVPGRDALRRVRPVRREPRRRCRVRPDLARRPARAWPVRPA